jgi:hypothetical protein
LRNEALNNTFTSNGALTNGRGMERALLDFQQNEQQNKFVDFRIVRDQIRAKNVDKAMSLAQDRHNQMVEREKVKNQ